ncbi:hypothetical protein J6590_059493 [Homalodisca vitripennis]|nr:hypothetical protein J6590_059493 [Homalodisca vitripennis]
MSETLDSIRTLPVIFLDISPDFYSHQDDGGVSGKWTGNGGCYLLKVSMVDSWSNSGRLDSYNFVDRYEMAVSTTTPATAEGN